jgi:acetyltransferase-like isoleucine patch superfamily enzyme
MDKGGGEKKVQIRVDYNHPEIGRGDLIAARDGISWKCGEGVHLDLTADIILDDKVEISDGVRIFTHRHNWWTSKGDRALTQTVTAHALRIGRDAFIGVEAMLIGVEYIGEGAIIGARAVVRVRRVGPYEVWAGNPAVIEGIRGEQRKRGGQK